MCVIERDGERESVRACVCVCVREGGGGLKNQVSEKETDNSVIELNHMSYIIIIYLPPLLASQSFTAESAPLEAILVKR